MENSGKVLITTSDERTWRFDRPVIFLGEWCRLYSQKHNWEKLDATIASPYGLDLASKIFDYHEVRYIEKILLTKASKFLNQVHGKNYSERFWKILIGHWLRIFIQVSINRYKTIKKCIEENEISSATFIKINDQSLIATDFDSFMELLDDPMWSSTVDLKILNLMPKVNFSLEIINQSVDNFIQKKYNLEDMSHLNHFKSKIFNLIRNSLHKCMRHTDALITNTYLSRICEIKLNFALGQLPQFWKIKPLEFSLMPNLKLRNELKSKFTFENENTLLKILSSIFFDLLPLAYLEGFTELLNLSQNQNFPKSPKFIFTSNDFQSNEVFKIWSANQTEIHTKYIVGQHGVNYGTHRFYSPQVEVETADIFLAFGEQKSELNFREGFLFTALNKNITSNPNGGLLFIDGPIDYRRNTWDSTFEHHQLFDRKKIFLSQVRTTINPEITVRLHPLNESKFQTGAKYYKSDPRLKIDKGYSKLDSLIKRNRLTIFSYESTGIIENLSLNVPTMGLFLDGFDYLVDDAKTHYQSLADVGIFHFSAESAVQKIYSEWSSIRTWWNDPVLQSARIGFCNLYGKTNKKPIRHLRKMFTEGA